ncbi:MAG: hypothetical protein LBD13_07600, partial [Spirochaetaceae bacterium]|nr:hypothetical protein [Spirochaetaceae bacterium]
GSPAPLDPDFDGALIAVLTNLAPNDTVSTDANGAIDSATFNAAPTAAKITGAFGGTNALILGVTWGIPGNGTVTIPVNKVFTVNAVDLTTVGAATIKVDGTLVVDKDGTDKVTIADAVITAGGAETLGDDTSGAVTLAANGSGIALGANGSVTTVGTATLVVGVTATGKVTINDAAITATAAAPAFASVASGVGTVNIGNTSIVLAATVPGAFTTAAAGIISAGGDTDKTVLVKAGITALSAGDTITATGDGVITVPASTIDLAAGGTATIAGNGALLVGGSSGTVRLEKAVYTATAASATFANVTSSVGSITIDATNILALGVGGKIAITGTSSVKGGTGFIIKGAGEWAVSGAGVTITLGAGGTTATIVGASASAILTPSSGTAEIAIQAAATSTGISIGPGMVDLSTNGKITIAQYGVLSLLANGVIKGGGTDANPLTSSNKAIVNAAAVGSDLVLKAATDTTSQVIGTITGAASNNTITPTGATAVTLDKTTTNT